jgi:ABC-type transport system involved in cytochrome bd biosynthesis fused ATPase/permease subunit
MSIKENILYGNSGASDEKVRQVAAQANALSFIEFNYEDREDDKFIEKIKEELEKKTKQLDSTEYANLLTLI